MNTLLIKPLKMKQLPLFVQHPVKVKGQASLEALIVLVFFIAILCFGISLMKEKLITGEDSVNALNAKSNALACSILLNGFFSNSAEEIQGFEADCFFEESGEIKGEFKGKKKSAFCLTKGEFLTQESGKKLIVEKLEHYR